MSRKTYKAAWAKIGNSSGYRLPSQFFKENPEFAGADGTIQVIGPNTAIVSCRKPEAEEAEGDDLVMSLYLDFLMQQALANPEELEAYTQAMADEDEALIAGVELDGD